MGGTPPRHLPRRAPDLASAEAPSLKPYLWTRCLTDSPSCSRQSSGRAPPNNPLLRGCARRSSPAALAPDARGRARRSASSEGHDPAPRVDRRVRAFPVGAGVRAVRSPAGARAAPSGHRRRDGARAGRLRVRPGRRPQDVRREQPRNRAGGGRDDGALGLRRGRAKRRRGDVFRVVRERRVRSLAVRVGRRMCSLRGQAVRSGARAAWPRPGPEPGAGGRRTRGVDPVAGATRAARPPRDLLRLPRARVRRDL